MRYIQCLEWVNYCVRFGLLLNYDEAALDKIVGRSRVLFSELLGIDTIFYRIDDTAERYRISNFKPFR